MARRRKAASPAVRVPHATKLELGTEPGPDGHRIGRDPRQMKPEELRAMVEKKATCPSIGTAVAMGLVARSQRGGQSTRGH